MDKSLRYENPAKCKLTNTSERTGIFEQGKEFDIVLFEPPVAGRPLFGAIVDGKEFTTSKVQIIDRQGTTYKIETKNSSYRIVAGHKL